MIILRRFRGSQTSMRLPAKATPQVDDRPALGSVGTVVGLPCLLAHQTVLGPNMMIPIPNRLTDMPTQSVSEGRTPSMVQSHNMATQT